MQANLESWRSFTLIALSAATLAVLGKVVLWPNQARTIPDYQFPPIVPLTGWHIHNQGALLPTVASPPQPVPEYSERKMAAHGYTLTQGDAVVKVQAYYVLKPNGEVQHALKAFGGIEPKSAQLQLDTRYADGIGSYVVFTHQQTAYLGSCINPHGGSTVTAREFKQNRNFADLRHRLGPWLLGEPLKDERCLWSFFATPIQNSETESSAILENAWFAWFSWWDEHFPPL
ncbi:MAG: cyanoexosortase A system-associated protein [Elainella sp. Prado103]|nr:cyanoexosortase A system-associated protein [Elainella sp. Prado103]